MVGGISCTRSRCRRGPKCWGRARRKGPSDLRSSANINAAMLLSERGPSWSLIVPSRWVLGNRRIIRLGRDHNPARSIAAWHPGLLSSSVNKEEKQRRVSQNIYSPVIDKEQPRPRQATEHICMSPTHVHTNMPGKPGWLSAPHKRMAGPWRLFRNNIPKGTTEQARSAALAAFWVLFSLHKPTAASSPSSKTNLGQLLASQIEGTGRQAYNT